jgi:CelD/BcsL family acetyltransferase involved in cellulose biosynthesis
MMRFDAVGNWPDVEDAWQRLIPRVTNQCFYQRPEWFSAFITVYPEIAATLHFYIICRGDEPVAIFPVQMSRRGKVISIRQFSLPVEHQLYMPDVILVADEDHLELLDYFLNHLRHCSESGWDLFAVRDALENTDISRALAEMQSFKSFRRNTDRCTIVRILPYDQALTAMRKNFRNNLARRKRQLEALDGVEFAVETQPERVTAAFEEFVELEASGWKGGHGEPRGRVARPLAIALNDRKRRFYKQAIESLAEKQLVEMFLLRVQGELVAAKIWICLQEQCFSLKTTFADAFSRYSPGILTFDFAYRHQLTKGTTRVINLVFEQQSLKGWGTEILHYQNHVCCNRSLRGRAAAALYSLRQ